MGIDAMAQNVTLWLQLIILLVTVLNLFAGAFKEAKKPNDTQNARLDALEKWKASVDERLDRGNSHFDAIDKGNRVTQKALLALISHAINGNDIEQLKEQRDDLNKYLVDR